MLKLFRFKYDGISCGYAYGRSELEVEGRLYSQLGIRVENVVLFRDINFDNMSLDDRLAYLNDLRKTVPWPSKRTERVI